jgi:hypothetical protein
MTTVLNSQMFERFVEERLADPDHPQIKVRRIYMYIWVCRYDVQVPCCPPVASVRLPVWQSPTHPHTHKLTHIYIHAKQFFDESIVAKLNRSKTQLKKGGTAFLDDSTDAVTETFNPPPPSNWCVSCV